VGGGFTTANSCRKEKQIISAKLGHPGSQLTTCKPLRAGGPAASCHKDNAKGGVAEWVKDADA
jgi:hypothetical protein